MAPRKLKGTMADVETS